MVEARSVRQAGSLTNDCENGGEEAENVDALQPLDGRLKHAPGSRRATVSADGIKEGPAGRAHEPSAALTSSPSFLAGCDASRSS
eukprot:scaffold257831_cov31-Tisochrysis_lutea.AAC.1